MMDNGSKNLNGTDTATCLGPRKMNPSNTWFDDKMRLVYNKLLHSQIS
jgi:hypothetical protein